VSTESSSRIEPAQCEQAMRSSRRQFLRVAGLGGVGLLASSMPGAQAAFSQTQKPAAPISADMVAKLRASGATAILKTEKLSDHIYVITGSGGNVAVLTGPDGKVMVDSGFGSRRNCFVPNYPRSAAIRSNSSSTPIGTSTIQTATNGCTKRVPP
jgi:hypothetical protein